LSKLFRHRLALLFVPAALLGTPALQAAAATAETLPAPSAVLEIMERVADWQIAHPDPKPRRPRTGWIHAAYTFGAMELAQLSPSPRFFDAMIGTGRANAWQLGPRPYHADDHAIGQLNLSLYARERDPVMLAATRARFDTILANPAPENYEHDSTLNPRRSDIWTWCDALFMAPATWIGLSQMTGDARYREFAVEQWWKTSAHLYDQEAHLYYRDNRYFSQREANGTKIFWGRGNGWVMGGLVRVLQALPTNHPSRPRFEQQFREMADALLPLQQADGLWRASLLDPASYPKQETSGSGFYCYAFAWGVNQGLLERARFLPATLAAWHALTACVTPEGRLTHVQPVGGSPKTFEPDSTEEYGAGAFLLAGSEIYRLAVLDRTAAIVTVRNPADNLPRLAETVEVDLPASGLPAAGSVVMDGMSSRLVASQELALSGPAGPRSLVFQVDLAPGETRTYRILPTAALAAVPPFPAKTHARFVPERKDDFAWENDRIAFRTYGPALAKSEGAAGSGLDVWAKRTRRLVVDAWYKRRYHHDEGEGLDYYHVGATRGAGGLGIWSDGQLHVSAHLTRWRLLTEGPIRTVFELDYDTWDAAGRAFTETKRITLDAGSNFNRIESLLRSPTPGPVTVGVGLVQRAGAQDWFSDATAGWLAHWEPEVPPHGRIGTALIVPGGFSETVDAGDNRLALAEAAPGVPFTYYAGAGWNQSGDFGDAIAWQSYVADFAARLRAPLEVQVQKR
jgi:rhamnogalacturonyl hydrolase YesR